VAEEATREQGLSETILQRIAPTAPVTTAEKKATLQGTVAVGTLTRSSNRLT
jgi:hypothetical protein